MLARDAILVRSLVVHEGITVGIDKGHFSIESVNGIPNEWLDKYRIDLQQQIVTLMGVNAFVYQSFNVGEYKTKSGGLSGGVTLQFTNIINDSNAYAVFNARVRGVRGAKKGVRYSGDKFNPPLRGGFIKLWRSTGLKTPDSTTSYYDYMGNLKGLLFTGDYAERKSEKLVASTIRPLTITHQEIIEALTYSGHITHTYQPHNSHITLPHKGGRESLGIKGLEQDLTTGGFNYGNEVIREYDNKGVINQSVDDWLKCYEKG